MAHQSCASLLGKCSTLFLTINTPTGYQMSFTNSNLQTLTLANTTSFATWVGTWMFLPLLGPLWWPCLFHFPSCTPHSSLDQSMLTNYSSIKLFIAEMFAKLSLTLKLPQMQLFAWLAMFSRSLIFHTISVWPALHSTLLTCLELEQFLWLSHKSVTFHAWLRNGDHRPKTSKVGLLDNVSTLWILLLAVSSHSIFLLD